MFHLRLMYHLVSVYKRVRRLKKNICVIQQQLQKKILQTIMNQIKKVRLDQGSHDKRSL